MREQFAGWGMYDHVAVCLTCAHEHLIAKGEQISEQPWLDWLTKHPGHENFIIPHKLRSALGGQVALRHNADVKIAYVASAAYTCTLTGLATSATWIVGRESTWISNASDKYLDVLVAGKLTVGTTPTAATLMEVHAVGTQNDTPTYPDAFTGTDSGVTITAGDAAAIKAGICRPIAVLAVTVTTSNITHAFGPSGIRQLFGDALPSSHGIFVTHNTGVNLNATASNQALNHTRIYATVV